MIKNKYKILSLVLLVQILTINHFAQSTVKIYGTVTDKETGIPLLGANILLDGTGIGTSSDELGKYNFENLLTGTYTISVSFIGYETESISNIKVPLDQPVEINIRLEKKAVEINAVTILADGEDNLASLNIQTITRDEIDRFNYQSVGDVLNKLPGIEIQSTGGLGSAQKISIRGSQTNQVLVLLDGIPLNDQLGGDVDLSKIPTNIIEKIDVYKGGNSPRFGNSAIGGVVNIITRNQFKNEIKLNTAYGSYDFLNVEPIISGSYNNFGYFFSFNYMVSKGDFPYSYTNSAGEITNDNRINGDINSGNIFARLNYKLGKNQFTVNWQRLQSERGIPGKVFAWTPYAELNNSADILGAAYKGHFEKVYLNIDLSYSNSVTENSNLYPDDTPSQYRRIPKYHYEYKTKNIISNFNIGYVPTTWFNFTFGYNFRNLEYSDENFRPSLTPPINEANDISHGFFFHQEWKADFPWLNTGIIFTPVIRYDEMKMESGEQIRLDSQWSPGAGLYLSMGKEDKIYIKGNIARSFRVPTFADLFYQDVRIEGKPDLLPEKSLNVDFSIGWQFFIWGRIRGEFTTYQYNVENLIVWRLGSFEVFRPFNTNAEISGQEYSIEFSTPNDLIELNFSYAKTEPLNKSNNITTNNKIIPYRPTESFKAGLDLNYNNFQLNLNYRNVGKRYVTEANTVEMPPYQVLDLNLSLITDFNIIDITWKFSVYNLSNEHYEIIRDYPLPLREWRIGVSLTY